MRVPLSWLREHVNPGLAPEELATRLSRTGTMVEAIHHLGVPAGNGNLGAFRVGRVIEASPHPNADRLRVCRVDLGDGAPRQIVCGAPNVAPGQTVAVALPGALLPGAEAPLKAARLRGEESNGMILSETELRLGDDAAGIIVLEDGIAAGTPLADVLPLSEVVLELEVTSNRPDCLAVYGVAREVHAVTGAPLAPLDESDPPAEGPGRVEEHAAIEVRDPDLCPRYMARVFTDVRPGPSPAWLRGRLEAAGMRAISNVVDITNYTMLLTGQPLHAFDLDRLAGRRVVARRARDGERIVTLDGQERVLDSAMLAICDAERPAVVAGIFGAEFAEVGEATSTVLLEAATFDGPSILDTSLRLGLRTESSSRFEKGLPRELPARAMAIASRLLVELAGARMVPGTLDALVPPPERPPVAMRHARVPRILGIEVAPEESAAILTRLGCEVAEPSAEALAATVPFERGADLTREIDLIEEVGRIHGLDAIPAEMPRVVGRGSRSPAQALQHRLERLAADLGPLRGRDVPLRPRGRPRRPAPGARRPEAHHRPPGAPHERRDGRDAALDAARAAALGGAEPAPPARRRRALRDRAHLRAARGRARRRAALPGGGAVGAGGRRGLAQRPAPRRRPLRGRPRDRADRRGRRRRGAAAELGALLPPGAPGPPGRRGGRRRAGWARCTRWSCGRST